MKKFVLGIFGLGFLFSFSYGAELSLSPSKGNIPENCIQAFNVNLHMNGGEKAITADLEISSNMEFYKFENGDRFKYATPERIEGDTVKIMLFNDMGGEITDGGVVGTLYYKTNVSDPYVNFVFKGKGNTTDTNINIAGMDILDEVISGQYSISADMVCENPITENYILSEEYKMDKFIQQFESDHKNEKVFLFFSKNKWYILGILGLLVLILLLLVLYRAQKKG